MEPRCLVCLSTNDLRLSQPVPNIAGCSIDNSNILLTTCRPPSDTTPLIISLHSSPNLMLNTPASILRNFPIRPFALTELQTKQHP